MERAIIVITGVMASGKSTVAEALAKSLPKCVHLHGDIFRKMIISGREEMSENPSEEALNQLDMRYEITAEVAKQYFDNGFTVVVQDNYLGEKLDFFTALLEDYPVYVIVLCPDVETIKQREAQRGKTGYTGFTVEDLYNGFMETTSRIGLWLNTSRMTIEETVNEILERAEKEARI
jgi:cytidylate kinase